MTKYVSILIIFLTFMLNAGGGNFKFANGEEKHFCVPKPSASEQELIANIEYACSSLGDCSIILPNGACFFPDTTLNHASVVMSLYYAKNNRSDSSCYFSNSSLTVLSDPSYNSCKFD